MLQHFKPRDRSRRKRRPRGARGRRGEERGLGLSVTHGRPPWWVNDSAAPCRTRLRPCCSGKGEKIIGKQVGTKRRFIFITSWAFHSSSPGLPSSSSGIFVSSSLMGFAEAVRTTRTVTIQNPVDIFTFFLARGWREARLCFRQRVTNSNDSLGGKDIYTV